MISTGSTVTRPSVTIFVQERQDVVDALGRVRDLDQDGKVLGETEDPRRVDPRVGAEPLDAADGRRARQTLRAHALHDRLVERPAVPGVGLADVDPQQLALALDLHTTLPATTPT
jgi:hypothetical protein